MTHRISAWDGLALRVLEWDGGGDKPPMLCLPGLARTAGDFAGVADVFGAGRRVLAVDYPGRGESGRTGRIARYDAEACLRDIMDVCAALH
ncbi:MAG: alpha/beta fold hydrolase, partial [Acetobacteraceae bacterium]